MNVWTVANQKGGVGKTTTSLCLAGLAAEQDKKVLLIDLDPHGSLSSFFRLNPDEQIHSVYSLFEQRDQLNEFLIRRCICETNQPGLFLLPASSALMSIDRSTVGADGMGNVISEVVQHLKSVFDVIIIDGPPMAGVLLVNSLIAATQILIPVQTEFFALQGLERLMFTLKSVQKLLSVDLILAPHLIVPTMHDRRTHASTVSLENLRRNYGSRVWHTQIATDTKLRDAMAHGVLPHRVMDELSSVNSYQSLLKTLVAGQARLKKQNEQ